ESGTGWEEQHAAAAGVDFVRLPIAGADGLNRDNVDAFAKALDATGGEPTLVSCGSSNRVGALFALKAYWRDGKSKEEAMAIGKAAGMTKLGAKVEELLAQPR
ncbi:MAG: serine/threonine protein phosphatase, partial [Planctomycetes bacterium]|nr:serine/threonine protein phosphatase [Planctomycetota bacterium]